MKLHDLRPDEGSTHRRKRVGRGESSGKGKTSGRGYKGTKARGQIPAGFEGGQMPLQRRLPKWGGFTSRNRIEYREVNVARIESHFEAGAVVDQEALRRVGLLREPGPVKVLGNGDITKALTVRASKFSASAKEKITAAGGTAEEI